ncbi:glycosyl hydrolase family 28 protein [Paenibacillus sp. PK3_47]|uniref:glycosyl hydrolase family 28 protein n=1 Tax=Paenibacillus sp. PK3_47 TaxID=2072642 RepID=UPI00201DD260|nr:glycosyl hydrolase family 28 protein [Paenibacillus sp. PK3_47]
MDKCFIYAEDAVNIGLTGHGEINGNAGEFPNEGSIYRPMMMRFLRCTSVHVKGLRLYNSTAWTTAFLDSENIWCEDLDIRNDKKYNGDGLDYDGCRNVFIPNCKILGTDDNLCLQASSKEYPMKNVHITNCHFTSICAGIRIGLKSIGDISNVTIHNCTFEDVRREGIKIECTEGGSITDIVASGLVMRNVTRPVFILLNNRPSFNGIRVDACESRPIRDLVLKNMIYTAAGGAAKEDIPAGYPKVWDMRLDHPEQVSENYYPDWSRARFMDIRNVERLVVEGVRFHSLREDTRESYIIENCKTLNLDVVEY